MQRKPGGCLRLFLILSILFIGISGGSVWVILNADRYVPLPSDTRPLAFTHVRIFTGQDTLTGLNTLVLYGDSVGCVGNCPIPPDARIMDAAGGMAMPALADMAFPMYLPTREGFDLSDSEQLIDYLKHRPAVRRALLQRGIGAALSPGDIPANIFSLKKDLDQDKLEGPLLWAVGPELTIPGGYPAHTRYEGDPVLQQKACRYVATTAEAEKAIQALVIEGAEGFRIIKYNGKGLADMDDALFTTLLELAGRNNRWVFARVGDPESFALAVQKGAALIEYLGAASPPDEALQAAAGAGVLTWLHLAERQGPALEALPALIKAFSRQGAPIGAGSGWRPSAFAGEGLEAEMAALIEAGCDPAALLRANTQGLFAALKADHRGGLLATGRRSSVALFAGDPLAGPPFEPVWVIHKGRVVRKP